MKTLLTALALVPLLGGCVIITDTSDWTWEGDWIERSREIGDVTRVRFDARGTLYVTQGDEPELRLEGSEGG